MCIRRAEERFEHRPRDRGARFPTLGGLEVEQTLLHVLDVRRQCHRGGRVSTQSRHATAAGALAGLGAVGHLGGVVGQARLPIVATDHTRASRNLVPVIDRHRPVIARAQWRRGQECNHLIACELRVDHANESGEGATGDGVGQTTNRRSVVCDARGIQLSVHRARVRLHGRHQDRHAIERHPRFCNDDELAQDRAHFLVNIGTGEDPGAGRNRCRRLECLLATKSFALRTHGFIGRAVARESYDQTRGSGATHRDQEVGERGRQRLHEVHDHRSQRAHRSITGADCRERVPRQGVFVGTTREPGPNPTEQIDERPRARRTGAPQSRQCLRTRTRQLGVPQRQGRFRCRVECDWGKKPRVGAQLDANGSHQHRVGQRLLTRRRHSRSPQPLREAERGHEGNVDQAPARAQDPASGEPRRVRWHDDGHWRKRICRLGVPNHRVERMSRRPAVRHSLHRFDHRGSVREGYDQPIRDAAIALGVTYLAIGR